MQLNDPQYAAVRCIDRPCLVLAGAGSGKTRVITAKIAYLIANGFDAKEIVALTFTNKAAQEMKGRADSLLNTQARSGRGLTVSTFHSLGVQLLRHEAKALGLKPGFSILDATDSFSILQNLLNTPDKKSIWAVANQISLWKNALLSPEAALAVARDADEQQAARIYLSYDATLRAYQAVDFDDLIRLPVQLFEQFPNRLTHWQAKIRYLLVDEYQDTNACQYKLMKLLAGARGAFTAVGDDDQSIYAWRGATLENIAQLEKDWPHLTIIKLEQNYRSSQRILHAANTLIAHNPKLFEKKLWSDHGVGDAISVSAYTDDEDEARQVVTRLIGAKFEKRAAYRDFAILYRSNYQARVLEQQLREQKIPYVMSGGQSFFERAEIKDISAYLRLLTNQDDDPAFLRAVTTPKRGIGNATLEALGTYAGERQVSLFEALYLPGAYEVLGKKLDDLRAFGDFINRISYRAAREKGQQSVQALMQEILQALDYEAHLYDQHDDRTAQNKWQAVLDFVQWIGQRAAADEFHIDSTLLDVAQTVAIMSLIDKNEADIDAVRLSTLHAAKGLEYPHVWMVGVEEGLLPHTRADEDEGAARVEEERRLMYVGITRAQRSLHLSWCKKRRRAREFQACEPSRFIAEMGLDAPLQQKKTEEKRDTRATAAALQALLKKNSAT